MIISYEKSYKMKLLPKEIIKYATVICINEENYSFEWNGYKGKEIKEFHNLPVWKQLPYAREFFFSPFFILLNEKKEKWIIYKYRVGFLTKILDYCNINDKENVLHCSNVEHALEYLKPNPNPNEKEKFILNI